MRVEKKDWPANTFEPLTERLSLLMRFKIQIIQSTINQSHQQLSTQSTTIFRGALPMGDIGSRLRRLL